MNKQICLNRSVLDFMDQIIEPDSKVLEVGGGWSSRWFADRCAELTVVENNPKWKRIINYELSDSDCKWQTFLSLSSVTAMPVYDLALIDCAPSFRDYASRSVIGRLKPGGWILFDDAQRDEHAKTVQWLELKLGAGVMLFWQDGDVESARERVTIAWQIDQRVS